MCHGICRPVSRATENVNRQHVAVAHMRNAPRLDVIEKNGGNLASTAMSLVNTKTGILNVRLAHAISDRTAIAKPGKMNEGTYRSRPAAPDHTDQQVHH